MTRSDPPTADAPDLIPLDRLSPLERRLQRGLAAELRRWLAPESQAPSGDSRLRSEWAARELVRATSALQAQREELELGFLELGRHLESALHVRQTQELLLRFLASLDSSPHRLAGDREAFARYMGPDVAAERFRVRVARIARLQELATRCAGVHVAHAVRTAAPDGARPDTLAELQTFAVSRLQLETRWQGRVAALEALTAVAAEVPEDRRMAWFEVPTIAAVTGLALERDENVWTQRQALELLYTMRPRHGLRAIEKRLTALEGAPPDDFFVRKHAVVLLGRDGSGDARALLRRLLREPDPSPYVRRTVVTVLAAAESEEAPAWLSPVLLDSRVEPAPQVRAQAAIELARVARNLPGGHPAVDRVIHDLAASIESDESATVKGIAMEEAADLLGRLREGRDSPTVHALDHAVLPVIDRLIAAEATPMTLRRRAALVRESILVPTLPAHARLARELARIAAPLDDGRTARLPAGLLEGVDLDEAGRILALASARDFSLSLLRRGRRWLLRRGEAFDTRVWRLWHELTHPGPDKRQAYNHSVGRLPEGVVRAPSGILAELTMTKVPGEKVFDDLEGEWRRYLPTVDDYLSVCRGPDAGRTVRIYSSSGVTTICGPDSLLGRLKSWLLISLAYSRLAGMRAATRGDRPSPLSDRYVRTFAGRYGILTEFRPHAYRFDGRDHPAHDPTVARVFSADEESAPRAEPAAAIDAASLALVLPAWFDPDYFLTREGNHVSHLAAYALCLFGAYLAEQAWLFRKLRRARRAMPLVLGGWGTRGKSGSERIKAGLFHGLGYSVFSKTTGCEAMFIHSVPGLLPMELFLFRPYDKATIWEQHNVVRLAADLDTEVFLWECMALKPDFVHLLQQRWMIDDYSTVTNTYPDHEDVQGPAGIDIPKVMCNFLGQGRTVFTAEDQMLPILFQGARANGADLRPVDPRELDLFTPDVLGRFPYSEHPKNIAMVVALAEHLGIDRDVALKEMADNVIPDLGVLKVYPMAGFQASHRGRTVDFTNGMSANERRGTVENWRRTGFDSHTVEREPGVYIVTVVNNRGDRVPRSKVFASLLVNDIEADCHVAIGTNLTGLAGYTAAALEDRLESLELVPLPESREFAPRPLGENLVLEWEAGMRLQKVRSLTTGEVLATLERMLRGAGLSEDAAARTAREEGLVRLVESGRATLEGMPAPEGEVPAAPELDAALASVKAALGELADGPLAADVLEFFERDVRRRASFEQFRRFLRAQGVGSGAPVGLEAVRRINAAYRDLIRGIWREKMRVLHDVHASGDQVIDYVLRQVPPGMHARVMGLQNIKGTGLGFVYRWISLDKVCGSIKQLESRSEQVRQAAVDELAHHGELGVLDAPLALEALRAARAAPANQSAMMQTRIELALKRIDAEYEKALAGLGEVQSRTALSSLLEWLEGLVDFVDSRRRRRMADQILQDLVDSRISHERAVTELRALVYRQKGGWLEKGLRSWWRRKG